MKLFPRNLDSKGRWLRFFFSFALFLYAYFAESLVALGFAFFTLFEALRGWCVVFQMLGKTSCPIKRKK